MSHGASIPGGHEAEHEHDHPGERTYIKVAIVLSLITLVEVVIYYLGLPEGLLVTMLLAFSAVKFVTVVGFFMHLKFDDRRLTYIFLAGLLLAGVILMILDVFHDAVALDYAQDVFKSEQAVEGEH
jgi:cytochrome c oxidase subunit IV